MTIGNEIILYFFFCKFPLFFLERERRIETKKKDLFYFFEINKAYDVFELTIGMFITLAKAFLFPITTRWTLPRLRMDQLLNLGWNFFYLFLSVIYY